MSYPNPDLCPQHTKESFDRYVESGILCGGFGSAVLENNLMEAVLRADSVNIEAIPHICAYVYHKMPASCHGSPEIVRAWIQSRRAAAAAE